MNRFLPSAVLASVLALTAPFAVDSQAAVAGAEKLKPAFGNTIVSTYPDGRTGLLWLKEDGTYTGKGRRRKASSGTWTVRGSEVCLKQKRPIPAPTAFCTPVPSGESWTAKAPTGERIRVAVKPGIVES